jgi:signal transduction histidine kinase
VLHCFYPEADYQQAWRAAVWPPVALGIIALLLVIVVSSVVSMRVTQPIRRLRDQVDRISRGDFQPLPVPARDDELRDLSMAVNSMSQLLAQYESHVRSNERLRTLDQLGGGIAHQLRNSVTGCRIAVDLHQRRCPSKNGDPLAVAIQQLELMEEFLKRFLSLGKQTNQPLEPADLMQIIEKILPLVRPRMDHLGIDFQWQHSDERLLVLGDADSLSQVVVNLLINAMEAAAQVQNHRDGMLVKPQVVIRLERVDDERARVEVMDSGPGPEDSIQASIFDPMVSSKHDGVGLGLAIVREVVTRHGGTIGWHRSDDVTCFAVELPLITQETRNADLACCR